jgi:3-phenylpropionate/cinnamic acid dioxygenase small subunit
MSELVEISSLLARIFHTLDDGDRDGFADCWSADATLRVRLYGQEDPIVLSGREQILGMAAEAFAEPGSVRHLLGSVAVDALVNDEATVRSYAVYLNVGEHSGLAGMGQYSDRVRKEGSAWRVVERVHTFLSPLESPPRDA